jgi:hypothetical protein
MENLNIQPTVNTPLVNFNIDSGKLIMKGRSIPEDPGEFYENILQWLKEYFSRTEQSTVMEFQIEYANSGSSKYILEILKDLQNYATGGKDIRVVWCYEEDDESIEELGELYQSAINIPFELKAIYDDEEDVDDDLF